MVLCLHIQILSHPCLPHSDVPIFTDIFLTAPHLESTGLEEEMYMAVSCVFLLFPSAWNMGWGKSL